MEKIEIGHFLKLFIRKGYVLDFSTSDFNIFTLNSVGVALCEEYEMSKGKSLQAFCDVASDEQIIKLFSDLLDYYECDYLPCFDDEKNKQLYLKCKSIMSRETDALYVEAPSITCVNNDYIRDITSRANRDLKAGEFDSVITKSRTLLEEVFFHVIEEKGEIPSSKGDIKKLYNQVKDIYRMHTDKDMDKRINSLLSGIEKVIDSIADMRNKNSDAHGVGQKRINISEYHARLYLNSAITLADFILSVSKNANKKL